MNWRCRIGFHRYLVVQRPTASGPGEEADVWCERCHHSVRMMTLFSDELSRKWVRQGSVGPRWAQGRQKALGGAQ